MAGLSVPREASYERPRRKTRVATSAVLQRTGSAIVELLQTCYREDYSAKETAAAEDSGWRTLVYVARSLKIPRSRLYGDKRREGIFSELLDTLVGSGMVEYRVFHGERGRGGRVVKVRARRP